MDSANACGVLGRGIEALRARYEFVQNPFCRMCLQLDKTYNKHKKILGKYFECIKFLDVEDRSVYLVKRKEKLKDNISKLK